MMVFGIFIVTQKTSKDGFSFQLCYHFMVSHESVVTKLPVRYSQRMKRTNDMFLCMATDDVETGGIFIH